MDILRGAGWARTWHASLPATGTTYVFVTTESRFLCMAFVTGIRAIQGNPASPMIFNIVVDAVVTAVLEVVCGPQEARHGMGWAEEERNLALYTDDGRILERYCI